MLCRADDKQFSISLISMSPGWLVLEKPDGLSVHNDPGKDLCSMVSAVISSDKVLSNTVSFDRQYGIHAVNRLDKETSGIMLMACRPETFSYYSQQFDTGTFHKSYIAILHGNSAFNRKTDEWNTWNRPLGKTAGGRKKPEGTGQFQKCVTKYRILKTSTHYALVECRPKTGRTHQIRRHAKLSGHPVVGDKRYGTRRSLKFLQTHCQFDRMALHSMRITFRSIDTKTEVSFRSPEIPAELTRLLNMD